QTRAPPPPPRGRGSAPVGKAPAPPPAARCCGAGRRRAVPTVPSRPPPSSFPSLEAALQLDQGEAGARRLAALVAAVLVDSAGRLLGALSQQRRDMRIIRRLDEQEMRGSGHRRGCSA